MATVTSLMTAEEYMALPDSFEGPTELVRGELVAMPPARPRQGEICAQIVYLLRKHLEDYPIGRVVSNDSSMVTERNPDTVRGPDVAYYSYERVPKGPLPEGLLSASPELVFEVRSPSDRWSALHTKTAEYLNANVKAVCVVDEETRTAHVFYADREPKVFTAADELNLPEILGDFRMKVERIFA
jgi:Uma2 family endonuclease